MSLRRNTSTKLRESQSTEASASTTELSANTRGDDGASATGVPVVPDFNSGSLPQDVVEGVYGAHRSIENQTTAGCSPFHSISRMTLMDK